MADTRSSGVRRRVGAIALVCLMSVGIVGTQDPPDLLLDGEAPDWLVDLAAVDLADMGGAEDGSGDRGPGGDGSSDEFAVSGGMTADEVRDLVEDAEATSSASVAESVPVPPLEADQLPDPGAWTVIAGEPGVTAESVDGESGPIDLALAGGTVDPAGIELDLEILDQDVADEVGASAFVFSVTEPEPQVGEADAVATGQQGGDVVFTSATQDEEVLPEDDEGPEDPGSQPGDGDADQGEDGVEPDEGESDEVAEPDEDEGDEVVESGEGADAGGGTESVDDGAGDGGEDGDVDDASDENDDSDADAESAEAEPVGRLAESLEAAEGGEAALPAELTIDFSSFAELYGGGYADRLRVVALPDCAMEEPIPSGCSTSGQRIPATVNLDEEQLEVEVPDLAELAVRGAVSGEGRAVEGTNLNEQADESLNPTAAVFAVTSGTGGEAGDFATPGGQTGSWQVSTGSGEFGYTYDVPVPSAAGEPPTVGLSYSSGAVDGLTSATNPQGSMVGIGWSDFNDAYIERTYEPCRHAATYRLDNGDLCWRNHNATINLNGVSGVLRPVDENGEEWRLSMSDPGWRVERLTGATTSVHDGEHWKVTSTDGTEYFFGLGENPYSGTRTASVLGVPVISNTPGDPCHGNNGLNVCDDNMGWRWNLDLVVDPDGNVTTYRYHRSTNRFESFNGYFGTSQYQSSAYLDSIEYGGRAEPEYTPTVRLDFRTQHRCASLNSSCPRPSADSSASFFPDVPLDLLCTSPTSCTSDSPSFFSTWRYSGVRTEVWADGAWQPVEQHHLNHRFEGLGSASNRKLYLDSVQSRGIGSADGEISDADIWNEPTTFDYVRLRNRVDFDDEAGIGGNYHWRISRVTNPLDGRTDISYGQNRPCSTDYQPVEWDRNVRDCFPQTMYDNDERRTGVFNKYLVTEVVEDPRAYLPSVVTAYEYGSEDDPDPAWAFNAGSFATYDLFWGWSQWRGYGTTTVRRGDAATQVREFRGMDGDIILGTCDGGAIGHCDRRSVEVESLDGSESFVDRPVLAGRTLQEAVLGDLGGVSETPVESTLNEYRVETTHPANSDLRVPEDTEWAGIATVTKYVATAPGEFRQQRTQTEYSSYNGTNIWLPTATLEEGWLDEVGDERCSLTTYAVDEASWMYEYPASNATVAGDCDSSEVLSASETFYDDSAALGELGSRGNPTLQRAQIDQTTWAETETEYDEFGRAVAVTDANGHTTTTTYVASPSNAIPTQVITTNELGHQTVTSYAPEHGGPVRQEGPNGDVTTWEYDVLGRQTMVWLPSEQGGEHPSSEMIYLPESPRRAVVSLSLTSDNGADPIYDLSVTFHDGLGRVRQTQTPSPEGDLLLVADTFYDDEGQVRMETGGQAVEADGLLERIQIPTEDWDNATRFHYDDLGRVVSEEDLHNGAAVRETTYEYDYDTVTVTGPTGHQAREQQDGFGRTISVAERDGNDWVSSSYEYDLAGNITSATDPEGNEITYTYNMVGQRLTQDDPNRGAASFGYNAAGEEIWVADALGNEVHSSYDPLGRPVERRADSPTGDLLASWEYDTAPGGVGMLHRETRHTDEGDWTSETLGYDERGNSEGTTYTVPEGIPGLSGEYTFTQEYDLAGRAISSTLPAVGGLPEETLTTTYDDLGLPRQLMGHEQYVWMVDYDDRARPVSAGYGPFVNGDPWLARHWEYNEDQAVGAMETFVANSTVGGTVSRHELDFDDAGNLTSRLSDQNGAEWRECHNYDDRQRLVESFTVEAAADCATGDPGTGDLPFERSYSYSADGNMLERVEDGETYTYSYSTAGSDQPHAPTTVNGDAYNWDANGNLSERTVDGETETLEWDVEQHLASVQGSDGTTEFVYGPGGERVLRRNPTGGATLFLGGHEISANADGSIVTGVRSYTFGGELVATRTSDQGTSYMVSDQAGSVEMAIEAGGDVDATRAYDPYGNVRNEEGEMPTEQGFVGQIEDPATDLSYLNARYYDTNIGVFISTDPIYDTNKIRSLNPYTYGAGNPTTFTDPSGLSPSYIWGLERANSTLRGQNSQLRSHISKLNGHIEGLQGVIRQQNRNINKLVTTVRAMDRIISQQQAYIHRLENAVRRLQSIVAQQQAEIRRLRATVRRQQRIIRAQAATIRRQRVTINRQAATISYYRGVVDDLGGELWGGAYVSAGHRATIHGGGWNASYASAAFADTRITQAQSELASYRSQSITLNEYNAIRDDVMGMSIGSEEWGDVVQDHVFPYRQGDVGGIHATIAHDSAMEYFYQQSNLDKGREIAALEMQLDVPESSQGGGGWGWVDDLCTGVGGASIIADATGVSQADKRIGGVLLVANGACMVAG